MYKMINHEEMIELNRCLGDLMTNWGNSLVQQSALIQEQLAHYLKYHLFEAESLKDIYRGREVAKGSYLRNQQALS